MKWCFELYFYFYRFSIDICCLLSFLLHSSPPPGSCNSDQWLPPWKLVRMRVSTKIVQISDLPSQSFEALYITGVRISVIPLVEKVHRVDPIFHGNLFSLTNHTTALNVVFAWRYTIACSAAPSINFLKQFEQISGFLLNEISGCEQARYTTDFASSKVVQKPWIPYPFETLRIFYIH
jgi:hypothetical protein